MSSPISFHATSLTKSVERINDFITIVFHGYAQLKSKI
jgi:hypothetical protein